MASQVELVNQALVKLGAGRITSLTDETKQARTMNAIYAVKRDAELASEPWTFAIRRVQLPASATPPGYGWAYQYPLPADYLKLVEVGENYTFYDSDTGALFQIEGTASGLVIMTDEPAPLKLRYVARVENTGLYPPMFVESFACRLAMEACEDLTQSLSKREAASNDRTRAIRDAKRVNAIEQPPRLRPPSSWVRALTED